MGVDWDLLESRAHVAMRKARKTVYLYGSENMRVFYVSAVYLLSKLLGGVTNTREIANRYGVSERKLRRYTYKLAKALGIKDTDMLRHPGKNKIRLCKFYRKNWTECYVCTNPEYIGNFFCGYLFQNKCRFYSPEEG